MERTKESTAHSGCAFVHVGPAGWLRAVSSSSSLLPSLGPVTASRYCYYQERLLSLFCEYVFAAFIIFTDVVSATAMAPDPYIKRDKSNNIANIEEPSLSWQVNPRVVCSLLGLAFTKWQPRIQRANAFITPVTVSTGAVKDGPEAT